MCIFKLNGWIDVYTCLYCSGVCVDYLITIIAEAIATVNESFYALNAVLQLEQR